MDRCYPSFRFAGMDPRHDVQEAVFQAFPFLRQADEALRVRLFDEGRPRRLGPGSFICMEGDRCGYLALVLSGSARVYKIAESGREITLYRIEPGGSCILTASCILSDVTFPAFAVTEGDVEALLVPAVTFREWVARDDVWRRYVFGLLSHRLATVIELVEEVAFRQVDDRLAAYLLDAASRAAPVVERTHEAIAADLGTSREVVSRILKDFERAGLVALSRGKVRVRDRDGLARKKVV